MKKKKKITRFVCVSTAVTVDDNVQCYSVTAGKTKGCGSAELTARGSTFWSREEEEEGHEEEWCYCEKKRDRKRCHREGEVSDGARQTSTVKQQPICCTAFDVGH